MLDLLYQLQNDATVKLNSESAFQYVPFAMYRKAVVSDEIAKRTPHIAGKGGKVGLGGLIMPPLLTGEDPNIAVPQGEVVLPVWVIEQNELNNGSNGTGSTAEAIAILVRAYLHQFNFRGQIALYQDKEAVQFIPNLQSEYPGCVGYQVLFRGRMVDLLIPQCALPTLTEGSALTVTLSTTDGAAIWYSTGGGFPGPANPSGSVLYTVPFTVAAGTVVAFASYNTGFRGSDCQQTTILS